MVNHTKLYGFIRKKMTQTEVMIDEPM